MKPRQITFHRRKNLQYYDVSAKSNYNFEKPFLYLISKVTGKPKLTLEGEVALLPPELNMDANLAAQYQQELDEANSVPVPAGEDDL